MFEIFSFFLMVENNSPLADAWFVLRYLAILGVFFYVVYRTTRYIGRTQQRQLLKRQIKVVERVHLGGDKSLIVVNLEGKSYVLGLHKNGIEVIDQRDDLTFEAPVASEPDHDAFSKLLRKVIKREEDKDREA
jgi:flagellar biogenesis protein FliO